MLARLEEQPLAVDRAHPVVPRHLAQPGASRATVADLAVDEQLDVDVGERLVTERPRPPQAWPVDVERPLDLVGPGSERVLRLADDAAVGRRAHADQSGRRRSRGGRTGAGGRVSRRRRGTARAAGRASPGRCRRRAPGATGRPGSNCRSTASECWNSPVMLRRPLVPRSGLQVTSMASTWSSPRRRQRRHVEAVGEEVALGIAQVRPVEPDVGLVEDAVEGDPPAPARRRRRQLEAAAVEDRTVALGKVGVRPPVPRNRDRRPVVVVDLEADPVAAEVVVGRPHPPRSRQIHGGAG